MDKKELGLIQIQTGRHYTDQGQRIIAKLWPEKDPTEILFIDLDRGIDGSIPIVRAPQDRFQMRDMVIFNYDHGQYEHMDNEQRQHLRSLMWHNLITTMTV